MNSKRVNNVISLLINEIKTNEQPESAKELAKEKGINVAKSFLNINHSGENLPCERPKRNCPAENGHARKSDHGVSSQEEQKTTPNKDNLNEDNLDDDVIGEKEKAALEFYDERIDIFEEEYVNKKYRYYTKNCDSSLCCCGCFIPVCYQSQRHETYVNQYRSLYAVNVRIDDKRVIYEHEINAADNSGDGKRSHQHGHPKIPPPEKKMTEEKSHNEPTKNESSENKYLSQIYSFLNSSYIKSSFESKPENGQNKKKRRHLSSRKAYGYLVRKFKKVAIECDLYLEEIQVQNENEKFIVQMFGRNSVTLKKLYRKKNMIDHYFFLLILFNILSNLPYTIIPIQKFVDICDSYITRGVKLLMKLNASHYGRKKRIHKIYFESVFYLFVSIWNKHYFDFSLSNTMVILNFFYKIYIILKKLEIRNVNLFDNIYVLCASYVNKINSMLWFSTYLIIKRMLIDECEIKIIKKKKTFLILPIFIDIIKILDVYDEIIKKTNISSLVKLYEELKLFLLFFFHKLLYNLITEQDMLPRNIFKYLQINNNIASNRRRRSGRGDDSHRRESSELHNSFYKYTNSINENFVFFSFFENFCLFNNFTEREKTNDFYSSLSLSFNSINSTSSSNENDQRRGSKYAKGHAELPEHGYNNTFRQNEESEKSSQIIRMHKHKIDILDMEYNHFFIHKYKNENKFILLIKSYFNDYLCALVNSLYIYSKIIYSDRKYCAAEGNDDGGPGEGHHKEGSNSGTENQLNKNEEGNKMGEQRGDLHESSPLVVSSAVLSSGPPGEKRHDGEENCSVDGKLGAMVLDADKMAPIDIGATDVTELQVRPGEVDEFHLIHRQKVQKQEDNAPKGTGKKRKTGKFPHAHAKIVNALTSFVEVIYKNIFKKVIKKIHTCKSISDLKLYSYIEKIYSNDTYYCLKKRLKKFCFVLFFSVTLKNLIKSYVYKIKKEKVNKNNLEDFQSILIYDTCSFIKIYNQLSEANCKDFFSNKYINFLVYIKNILTLPRQKLLLFPVKNRHFFFYIRSKRVDIHFDSFVEECKLKNQQMSGEKTLPKIFQQDYYILPNSRNSQISRTKYYAADEADHPRKNILEQAIYNIFQSLNPFSKVQRRSDADSYSGWDANQEYSSIRSVHHRGKDPYDSPTSVDTDGFVQEWKKKGINKEERRRKKEEEEKKKNYEHGQVESDAERRNIPASQSEIMNNSGSEKKKSATSSRTSEGEQCDGVTAQESQGSVSSGERKSEDDNSGVERHSYNEHSYSSQSDVSSLHSGDLEEQKFTQGKSSVSPFEMTPEEKKYCMKVYMKNSSEQFDRKVMILKNDKIYFYNSEYAISYDSFYFLMEIKKIYSCDGFFDSLINSQRISVVNSTYSSTEDEEFNSRSAGSLSSESGWQKCGFDAKIIFHNSLRKNIQLMFIDESYEKMVSRINSSLVHETDRTFAYTQLSYDEGVERDLLSHYLQLNVNEQGDSSKSSSSNESNSAFSNGESRGGSSSDRPSDTPSDAQSDRPGDSHNGGFVEETEEGSFRDATRSYEKFQSSHEGEDPHSAGEKCAHPTDAPDGENLLNKILEDNQNLLQGNKNETQGKLKRYPNLIEYKYSSSTTDIYIRQRKYFAKKKKIKVRKENKMKLFKNIDKNDIYNLFYEEICRLCKKKNNNISKTNSDDLFFHKYVNKLYHTANLG
ncbi:Uncharacterized protein PCOAH_00009620 [Plasmodium coatneyi]|uniref:Uncharacterized protein n=1 Tax=Plasmodium coatneyi TaxID=208452 RepID=A0A1B1DUR5_9APIC|nr:Uncharacterized protein PCOAH_00009620 [Plasmodium coatneyi]ANQ06520.1 Uncharacterized protein PCOAH_00009620 [Plasmodium coatneyi]